jgi:hypothetical protein
MGFGIPLMLTGLAGIAIPVLIHLFNRRRYDVVDWAAMQFLQVSETTRRRLILEQLLLMLVRAGLIALLVLALAAPYTDHPAFAKLGMQSHRDVVLLIDGSASMGYTGGDKTAHEAAKEWASAFVGTLDPEDSVAILHAKQQVIPALRELSHDRERVRVALGQLSAPSGGCDWPSAVGTAFKILSLSPHPERDLIILSDGQRFGWADEATLLRWELLARFRDQEQAPPRISVVNLDPKRPENPPNWSLAPIRSRRAVASVGQQLRFQSALELRGQKAYQPPFGLRLEIDGQQAATLTAPATAQLDKGQIPLSFEHRFHKAGSHLVSLIVEPDPPADRRPAGYVKKDNLPADNRQDLAVEVLPALPVLLVDGDVQPAPRERGTDFLRDALSPALDPHPAVLARVISLRDLDAQGFTRDLGSDPGTKPRVVVLVNVARLNAGQEEAVRRFLASGGGVLITLGDRTDTRYYNEQLYEAGQGWLPCRLEESSGDETRPEQAVSPQPSSFLHPALELFREARAGGLGDARFPRWWKVTLTRTQTVAAPIATLSNQDPWLVEREYQGGRVVLCTTPLNNAWRTNLPHLPAFAPLAHELLYYLAGARQAENNVQPGQPLRFRREAQELVKGLRIQCPDGETRSVDPAKSGQQGDASLLKLWDGGSLILYEHTQETGVYRLTSNVRTTYYVVQPDGREADLTRCGDEDRERVRKILPLTYEDNLQNILSREDVASPKQELWWGMLSGVVALLLCELWLTRRVVKRR